MSSIIKKLIPVKKPGLFEVFGVEMEYMIVDAETLAVKPIADLLINEVAGDYVSDVNAGEIAWSNELVSHVIELKTNGPKPSLENLPGLFAKNVVDINKLLKKFGAKLMPTASHPLMDPLKETVIWPHEHNEIYELYNRVFDCKGHGWANLQSTHLNLPFANDGEFGRLHAAIRLVLPMIPALSASSPIMEGKWTGFLDGRLEVYRHNQEKIPSIAGKVVPEAVFSKKDYENKIFNPIKNDIRPFDKHGVLDHHFLNSRGAIARFDRGAIEIRIIDIQECPAADIAILTTIVQLLKTLVNEKWSSYEEQQKWHEDTLSAILLRVIERGGFALISDKAYLSLFGIKEDEVTAKEFWKILVPQLDLPEAQLETISFILKNGSLSSRILNALDGRYKEKRIKKVYEKLSTCLAENRLFDGDR